LIHAVQARKLSKKAQQLFDSSQPSRAAKKSKSKLPLHVDALHSLERVAGLLLLAGASPLSLARNVRPATVWHMRYR
jgi:hypothetical protein